MLMRRREGNFPTVSDGFLPLPPAIPFNKTASGAYSSALIRLTPFPMNWQHFYSLAQSERKCNSFSCIWKNSSHDFTIDGILQKNESFTEN